MKAGWNHALKEAVPRQDIPAFLSDLQTLVQALREDRAWTLTPRLRAHPDLVLDYLDEGPKRDRVAAGLQR